MNHQGQTKHMITTMMNQKVGLTDLVSCPTMEIPGRRIHTLLAELSFQKSKKEKPLMLTSGLDFEFSSVSFAAVETPCGDMFPGDSGLLAVEALDC